MLPYASYGLDLWIKDLSKTLGIRESPYKSPEQGDTCAYAPTLAFNVYYLCEIGVIFTELSP